VTKAKGIVHWVKGRPELQTSVSKGFGPSIRVEDELFTSEKKKGSLNLVPVERDL